MELGRDLTRDPVALLTAHLARFRFSSSELWAGTVIITYVLLTDDTTVVQLPAPSQ